MTLSDDSPPRPRPAPRSAWPGHTACDRAQARSTRATAAHQRRRPGARRCSPSCWWRYAAASSHASRPSAQRDLRRSTAGGARPIGAAAPPPPRARRCRSENRHTAGPRRGRCRRPTRLPSSGTAPLQVADGALWAGVVQRLSGPRAARVLPRGAYVQLKAVGAPGSDWRGRLVHDYALDLAAAHGLLGPGASIRAPGAVKVLGELRALGAAGRLLQQRRLLRDAQRARRLPRARAAPLVRHRLDDLLARRLVRGAHGRRCCAAGERASSTNRRPARQLGVLGHLLTAAPRGQPSRTPRRRRRRASGAAGRADTGRRC